MFTPSTRTFPIPVVSALGPGSQEDDGSADYLPMPQGMSTYHPPSLPEPEALAGHEGCIGALEAALAALQRPDIARQPQVIDLSGLDDADRTLLNQVLGEGEVAAQVAAVHDGEVAVQESVFTGVWRVLRSAGGQVLSDTLEVGTIPQVIVQAAQADGASATAAADEADTTAAADLMNAPALLTELADRAAHWQPEDPAHVVNLSLLPLTPADCEYLDRQIGAGRVTILSRGYGNCRITSTRRAHTWRVTYFNSMDLILLDSLEVCAVPAVGCASADDLQDSAERLAEVLDWVRQG